MGRAAGQISLIGLWFAYVQQAPSYTYSFTVPYTVRYRVYVFSDKPLTLDEVVERAKEGKPRPIECVDDDEPTPVDIQVLMQQMDPALFESFETEFGGDGIWGLETP